jgi:predicted anti-sigma-YlaC factor YlaD
MDHDEVLEQLELAAVEPDGLARLVAGDTAIAAAVVGHLAGCDACSGEFQRLGRAAPLLREVVRTTPPSDLRERTLAYVREHGEPRGVAASAAAAAAAAAMLSRIHL